MKKRKTPDLEKYLEGKKRRFVNYTQGAKIYKMSYWPFVRLAKKQKPIIRFYSITTILTYCFSYFNHKFISIKSQYEPFMIMS